MFIQAHFTGQFYGVWGRVRNDTLAVTYISNARKLSTLAKDVCAFVRSQEPKR